MQISGQRTIPSSEEEISSENISSDNNIEMSTSPPSAGSSSPPSIHDPEKLSTPRKRNPFAGKSTRFWIAFATLCFTAFISALDAVIIAAALPAIASELKGTSNQAFWSGTAFLLAATITQPLYGTFSEIFGRRL